MTNTYMTPMRLIELVSHGQHALSLIIVLARLLRRGASLGGRAW